MVDEVESWWRESWSCGVAFVPELQLATALAEEECLAHVGEGSLPPLLVANLPPVEWGVVALVKTPGGWRGHAIEAMHRCQAAYVSPETGEAVLFTMHSVQSPGGEYRVARLAGGLTRVSCGTLPFPEEFNSPASFLTLYDFNADAQGQGVLVGSGEIERPDGEYETRWYRFRTEDGGLS